MAREIIYKYNIDHIIVVEMVEKLNNIIPLAKYKGTELLYPIRVTRKGIWVYDIDNNRVSNSKMNNIFIDAFDSIAYKASELPLLSKCDLDLLYNHVYRHGDIHPGVVDLTSINIPVLLEELKQSTSKI